MKPLAAWLHAYGWRPDDRHFGAEIQEIRSTIAAHGIALGTRICEARELLRIVDPSRLRVPPTGWTFTAKLTAAASGSEVGYTDQERADMRSFWTWYLPVEGGLLRLCALIREISAAGPAHEELLLDLRVLGQKLLQRYRDWERDGRIGWLPRRIGPRHSRVSILGALAGVLVHHDGSAPPAWAVQNEPPMEMPF